MTATLIDHRSGHVPDARGRSVSLVDPVPLLVARRDDPIDRATLEKIVRDVGPGIAKWPRRAAIFGAIGIVVVFGVLTARLVSYTVATGRFPIDDVWRRLPVLIGIAAGLWFHWFAARRVRLGRVQAAMLGHQRCPHCGYDLRGLPADPRDDAVACPECGCAWIIAPPETPP